MSPRLLQGAEQLTVVSPGLEGVIYVDSLALDHDPGHVVPLVRGMS
jgi:hypothetical protein